MTEGARVNLSRVDGRRDLKFTVYGPDIVALVEAIKQVRKAFPEIVQLRRQQRRPSFNVSLIEHDRYTTRDGKLRHDFHYFGEWSTLEEEEL